MNNYLQYTFTGISAEQGELLIAQLTVAGFEGFEDEGSLLKAFISEKDFDEGAFNEIVMPQGVAFSKSIIRETNWNELWESNFQPVIVDDFAKGTPWVSVRADFHEPVKGVEHEIVITPKMSFGTGHHATTFMMIQSMRDIDFAGKTVVDFGTGTGVLAILAERKGASKVIAIDNDEWSIANAAENLQRNNCSVIDLQKAESFIPGTPFDIILANINKNVILENFHRLVEQTRPGSVILLSGLLSADEQEILDAAKAHLLVFASKSVRDNWLCLKFIR